MTRVPGALAAGHAAVHSTIPSPVTIALAVAAVGWVLWSRMQGQPLRAKRLLVLPVLLTVLGITDLTGSAARHLTPADIGFLAVSVAISAVLGAARGATIVIYPNQGELWQRYRPVTAGLWVILIVAKLVLMVAAGAAGASAGGGTSSLLLSLGVSLLAEAAIVGPRALSTGLPFAADRKDSGSGRPGRSRPPSPASGSRPLTPPLRPRAGSEPDSWPEPVPPRSDRDPDDDQPWRSPRVGDGMNWLRQQASQLQQTDWNEQASSPGPADDGRGSHHDRRHHGRTGPS